MKLPFKVTAEHIRKGLPHLAGGCPMALALNEAFEGLGLKGFSVSGKIFAFTENGLLQVPNPYLTWMCAFDGYAGVDGSEPFEGEIDIPAEFVEGLEIEVDETVSVCE